MIVEGEFDALCLGQELAGQAGVVTLGAASARPDPAAFRAMLSAPVWYVATDGDGAGDKASEEWPAGPFKDWTDAKAAGVDLCRWWSDRLAGIDPPNLFTWPDLAARRWGPGLTDPTPGIDFRPPEAARQS